MAEAGNQTGQSSAQQAAQSGQGGNTGQSATTSSQQSQQQTQQTNGQQQTGQQQTGGADRGATQAERPSDLPESLWLADKRTIDYGKLNEIVTRDAADQVRRNSLPGKAEDLTYTLPKDFKAPEGVEFKFNEQDQNLQGARALMHDIIHGKVTGQEAFSKMLGLYAGVRVNETQAIKTARDAELGKLGPTATARMSAINTFLEGTLGAADAKPLQDAIWTAAAAQSWEKLITKLATGHGSRFAQNGRDGRAGQAVDQKTYDGWSPAQRLNYARTGDPDRAM